MANDLSVMPAGDPALDAWLIEHGLVAPRFPGRMPRIDEITAVLMELDWPFHEFISSDTWHASAEVRDGRIPPFSAISVHDTSYFFRLGPLFGPFEIVRRLAAECGPQVAVEASGTATAVIEIGVGYESFHERMTGCPPPVGDKEWDWVLSEDDQRRGSLPAGLRSGATSSQLLELALSDRDGCDAAALWLGMSLDAFRRRQRGEVVTVDVGPVVTSDESEQIIHALMDFARSADVPSAAIIRALGQAPDRASAVIAEVAERLRGRPEAVRSAETARLFAESRTR